MGWIEEIGGLVVVVQLGWVWLVESVIGDGAVGIAVRVSSGLIDQVATDGRCEESWQFGGNELQKHVVRS